MQKTTHRLSTALALAAGLALPASAGLAPEWDTYADTWVATDGLGRSLPVAGEVEPPRTNRTVAMFYFLWHGGHGKGGPYDISKILAAPDPKPWGPPQAFHHWGEPLLGYYVATDRAVLRKHLQMLADAGVDALILDATNGFTYPEARDALVECIHERLRLGLRTPRIAWFANGPAAAKLYQDGYEGGRNALLGTLAGPPFAADGRRLAIASAGERSYVHTVDALGLASTQYPACRITLSLDGPATTARLSWRKATSGVFTTGMSVEFPVAPSPTGRTYEVALAGQELWTGAIDELRFYPSAAPATAGLERIELVPAPGAPPRAWAFDQPAPHDAWFHWNGKPLLLVTSKDWAQVTPEWKRLFTLRKTWAFERLGDPDHWSFMQGFPQDPAYTRSLITPEFMSVSVAQQVGYMSDPGSRGRSFSRGVQPPPGQTDFRGRNFAEQFDRAIQVDQPFIFITGWNEWVAQRQADGPHGPRFVDQYSPEFSRDLEPMKGGHGDAYYLQLAAGIRRFKGVRRLAPVSEQTIAVDGAFADWAAVRPEFRDDPGDPVRRDHPGWGAAGRYVDASGRNDLLSAKVAYDATGVYFYVRTAAPLTPPADTNWMILYLNLDGNPTNGWLGYDVAIGRRGHAGGAASVERWTGPGYAWSAPGRTAFAAAGNELELALPRAGPLQAPGAIVDFKWADHIPQTGDWSDFTLHGDAAPNDRFNYRAALGRPPAPPPPPAAPPPTNAPPATNPPPPAPAAPAPRE